MVSKSDVVVYGGAAILIGIVGYELYRGLNAAGGDIQKALSGFNPFGGLGNVGSSLSSSVQKAASNLGNAIVPQVNPTAPNSPYNPSNPKGFGGQYVTQLTTGANAIPNTPQNQAGLGAISGIVSYQWWNNPFLAFVNPAQIIFNPSTDKQAYALGNQIGTGISNAGNALNPFTAPHGYGFGTTGIGAFLNYLFGKKS